VRGRCLVLALARGTRLYFAALSSASTGFAALYLFALLGSFPEFERRDMSVVMLSLSLWSIWSCDRPALVEPFPYRRDDRLLDPSSRVAFPK